MAAKARAKKKKKKSPEGAPALRNGYQAQVRSRITTRKALSIKRNAEGHPSPPGAMADPMGVGMLHRSQRLLNRAWPMDLADVVRRHGPGYSRWRRGLGSRGRPPSPSRHIWKLSSPCCQRGTGGPCGEGGPLRPAHRDCGATAPPGPDYMVHAPRPARSPARRAAREGSRGSPKQPCLIIRCQSDDLHAAVHISRATPRAAQRSLLILA